MFFSLTLKEKGSQDNLEINHLVEQGQYIGYIKLVYQLTFMKAIRQFVFQNLPQK